LIGSLWAVSRNVMRDCVALARAIAARSKPRFIEVPFTEDELLAIRGGRTAEEYRLHLIRTYIKA
jgi:hypothetical protein